MSSRLNDKSLHAAARSYMDHARSTFVLPFRTLCVCAASAVFACGFGGRVDLGDDGGRPPTTLDGDASQSASGGATTASGGQTSVIGSGGSSSVGGPLGGATAASGGAGALPTALVMDATGVVPASTNAYGIQAKWYAFSDEVDGGQTRIDGYYETMVPFVPGRGMCINGTTQSGLADDWKTWGAGIGIALHVVDEKAETLVDPPACFTLVISSDAAYPMELRADLNPTDDGSVMPPNVPLHPGVNEVCLRDAQTFQYCTQEMVCLPPEALNQGLAKLNVVAPSGVAPGPISFCIESLTPHD